jgi:hypothetical protein
MERKNCLLLNSAQENAKHVMTLVVVFPRTVTLHVYFSDLKYLFRFLS